METLRYPIGEFSFDAPATPAKRAGWIEHIRRAPAELRAAVTGLNDEQLDTPYREGGWTLRQVVHHLPDSHLNSYIRFRWALTEDRPTIKAYDEASWATLADAKTAPVELSLALLGALHERWIVLLNSLSEAEFERVFIHPESGHEIPLARNLALYAWHGKHHIAQIMSLRERMDW